MPEQEPLVIVAAGRRVDAPGTHPSHFPLAEVERVSRELRARLRECGPGHVVASAACGADLLLLEAALERRIPYTVVLPFDPPAFRALSVVDRPGDWGPRFDRVLADAARVLVLDPRPRTKPPDRVEADDAYEAATRALTATARSANAPVIALVIWDGRKSEGVDFTAMFRDEAAHLGWPVIEVSTVQRRDSSQAP